MAIGLFKTKYMSEIILENNTLKEVTDIAACPASVAKQVRSLKRSDAVHTANIEHHTALKTADEARLAAIQAEISSMDFTDCIDDLTMRQKQLIVSQGVMSASDFDESEYLTSYEPS